MNREHRGSEVLGEGFNELEIRGVEDVLGAVPDGAKGIPEALAAVYLATTRQTCIVRLIRNSLDLAS